MQVQPETVNFRHISMSKPHAARRWLKHDVTRQPPMSTWYVHRDCRERASSHRAGDHWSRLVRSQRDWLAGLARAEISLRKVQLEVTSKIRTRAPCRNHWQETEKQNKPYRSIVLSTEMSIPQGTPSSWSKEQTAQRTKLQ